MNKRIFSIFFAVLLVSSLAIAATVTIRPDGQGYRTGWTNYGCALGSGEWDCVDEDPASTAEYLYNTGTAKETFGFDDTGLTSENINSITLYYYASWRNSIYNSCFEAMTRSGSTDYLAGTQMCVGSSWTYVNHTYATNPATSSTWTVSDVDELEAGMHSLNPYGGGQVAQVYAVVDYDPFVCGNDEIEGDEICDGTDLGGETCYSQGFDGGDLACNEECDGFDTSSCWDNSCSDTDGGFYPQTAGTVSGDYLGFPYSFDDFCVDGLTLMEYYCGGDRPYNWTWDCSNQTGCLNGACY